MLAYFIGYRRSHKIAQPIGGVRKLATLPSYYASMMALWAFIPALVLIVLWLMADGMVIDSLVKSSMPEETKKLAPESFGLVYSRVENVALGIGSAEDLGAEYQPAVERLRKLTAISKQAMPVLTIILVVLGALIGSKGISAKHNARYGCLLYTSPSPRD